MTKLFLLMERINMGVELTCLKESAHLMKRGPKYWFVVGHMYGSSLFNRERASVFRSAYYFCRYVDDVLDGDRKAEGNPMVCVNSIVEDMRSGKNNHPISALYHRAMSGMKKMVNAGDNPERDFEDSVDTMIFDYVRSQDRRVLARKEVEEYYDKTFIPVLNIGLVIAGSKLRGRDVEALAFGEGHVYSIFDMKTDLERGTINIPSEELTSWGVNLKSVSYENLIRNTGFLEWRRRELIRHAVSMNRLEDQLNSSGDRGARKVCFPAIRDVRELCEKGLDLS